MKELKCLVLVLLGVFLSLFVGLKTIAEFCHQELPFFDLIDKNPVSSFLILTSLAAFFLGRKDKNIHSLIGFIFLAGALVALLISLLVIGDISIKICIVGCVTFFSYYIMYHIGRNSQSA